MVGADARFLFRGIEIRGQVYYTAISNTEEYNFFTRTGIAGNDLGKTMVGYYIEAGYNVFKLFNSIDQELVPFIRYEFYNTHQSVDLSIIKNLNYENILITTGLTYRLTKKAAIKTDIQFLKSAVTDKFSKTINAGIGVMF
ncbi:MAG: hypothetical protein IPJ37_16490 [Bacteroidales bacterium]|nr:hypothetical protein [Bacteroidales bacterium]